MNSNSQPSDTGIAEHGSPDPEADTGPAATEVWLHACATADVGEDFPTKVELEGGPTIAVYRVEGQFYATADKCTHGEASLSDGLVDGHVVECPFHSGTFNILTGEALTFPCTEPVAVFPVRLDGDQILVRID